jgi:hypothetical protein
LRKLTCDSRGEAVRKEKGAKELEHRGEKRDRPYDYSICLSYHPMGLIHISPKDGFSIVSGLYIFSLQNRSEINRSYMFGEPRLDPEIGVERVKIINVFNKPIPVYADEN